MYLSRNREKCRLSHNNGNIGACCWEALSVLSRFHLRTGASSSQNITTDSASRMNSLWFRTLDSVSDATTREQKLCAASLCPVPPPPTQGGIHMNKSIIHLFWLLQSSLSLCIFLLGHAVIFSMLLKQMLKKALAHCQHFIQISKFRLLC